MSHSLPLRLRRSLQGSQTTGPVLLAAAVGLCAGAGAIVLRALVEWVRELFFGAGVLVVPAPAEFLDGRAHYWVAPTIGMMIAAWMTRAWAPEAKGHGVPEVQYAVLQRGGRIRPRVAAVKALASAISIGTGGSVGREGPIVQIGSSLGSTLGQMAGFGPNRLRVMVAGGAAGAIGATFNAPIAGVMFAMEVILGDFATNSFGLVVVSSVSATVLVRGVLGAEPAFHLAQPFVLVSEWELIFYATMGVLAGIMAIAYTKSIYLVEEGFDRWRASPTLKAAAGGLIVGGIGYFGSDLIFGVGHEGTEMALNGQLAVSLMLGLVVLKMVATSVTLGAGGSGGVFAPALFSGAMLGGAFGTGVGMLAPTLTAPPGAYALVGMAALFGSAAHAPLTAIVILFEMTDDYQIILPLMLSVVIGYLVASRLEPDSIYSVKLRRMGGLKHSARELGVLDLILVDDAMILDANSIRPETPIEDLIRAARGTAVRSWPVTDMENRLLGMVSVSDIENALLKHGTEFETAGDVMTTSLRTVMPHQSLRDAFDCFAGSDVNQVPVVSREDEGELVGMLQRSEILWATKELSDEQQRSQDRSEPTLPASEEYVLIETPVDGDTDGLAFVSLGSLRAPDWALVAMIRRADRSLVPRGSTVIEPGDLLIWVTTRRKEDDLRRWIRRRREKHA
jgi:chloride channel protein, CIC family